MVRCGDVALCIMKSTCHRQRQNQLLINVSHPLWLESRVFSPSREPFRGEEPRVHPVQCGPVSVAGIRFRDLQLTPLSVGQSVCVVQ